MSPEDLSRPGSLHTFLEDAIVSRNIIFCLLLIVSFVFSVQVFAHGGGQFSAAIIDSLKVHHAHIENEQKITFSYLDNFRNENGKKRSAFQGEIELAIVWDKNSRWGSEILIPYSNTGTNKIGRASCRERV